ncbi:MAG: hypothetical protein JWP91_3571 [Fibrobacteres bacterium]|nr:hypothetical protein [Fibrobacterota bacterium]
MKNHTLLLASILSLNGWIHAQADWASLGKDGKLAYKSDANGNRIMDFSSAGYLGGGVALPTVPIKATLKPSGGDDTKAIQDAIDQVSQLPPANGFRGAVCLAAGTFHTSGPVKIRASGVVVRGSGSGSGGTLIQAAGESLFGIEGTGSHACSGAVDISGDYVPSGTLSMDVKDASGFSVGDNVLITKTATKAWIHYMGMDSLYRVNDATGINEHQTWLGVGTSLNTDRTIVAITGNRITFDGPITDNFDAKYLGNPVGTVSKYAFPGRINRSAIERLKIVAAPVSEPFTSVRIAAAMDCWVRDVVIQDGTGNLQVEEDVRRVTVSDVSISHTVASTIVAKPADFTCTGTQILFDKCRSAGEGSWPWTTGGRGSGPMVVLNFKTTQTLGITPHMRWTTGILADGDTIPDAPKNNPGLSFRNRATAGSGHGWTTGWSVAWNVLSPYFLVSNAPGTLNWAIGGKGVKTSLEDPDGIYDHFNSQVAPVSLYLQQLQDRLGPQAVRNIGYEAGPIWISQGSSIGAPRGFAAEVIASTLAYTLQRGEEAVITLYRTDGSRSGSARVPGRPGRNTFALDGLAGPHGPSGIYLVKVAIGGESRSLRALLKQGL